jgi:manganese-dependent ADP-ribose/CDP-alcohol diphosphatase
MKKSYRFSPFILVSVVLFVMIICTFILLFWKNSTEFSIGLIADCQYREGENSGTRRYSLSQIKLKNCISDFNTKDLAFVVHLGDFIDANFSSFDIVQPIFSELTMPGYHVLGNHDFAVADIKKDSVYKRLQMPARYYDFIVKGWHFIILDGNDISFHAYPEGSEPYQQAENYYQQKKIQSPKWNGAVGAVQMSWLQSVLNKAQQVNEPVILFSHFPVYPDNVHNLWNAQQIIEIIEGYPNVRAYINGHNHAGNYAVKNSIHYLTLKGMVETEQTADALMTFTNKKLVITGFGREQNRTLFIPADKESQ